MNERIKELRKVLGVTQQEFADNIKVKRNTVATYEMGRSIPSDSAIALICEKYGVNEEWLRTGIGEMFLNEAKDIQITNLLGDVLNLDQTDFKRRLVSALAKLDKDGWTKLEELIDMISEK